MTVGRNCNTCGGPAGKAWVKYSNPNAWNHGRPYTACPVCPFGQGFVTWEDDIGLQPNNPPCLCGQPARQDRMGAEKNRGVLGFWTCPQGLCGYYSEDVSGVPSHVAAPVLFRPWMTGLQ